MTSVFRFLAPVLLVTLLSACSSDELQAINPFADKTPPPPCPKVNLLADAATLTKFRPGPGEALIDVLFEAEFANVLMGCEHDIDDETNAGTLGIDLQMLIQASRGPADKSREGLIRYFVTLTDKEQSILGKEVFEVKAPFPGNRTRVRVTDDPVEMTVPLKAGQTGRNFQIYVGFQLSQEELAYNRRKRQLTRH